MYDVIPDIHGQSCKLTAALKKLGYVERNGAWRHSDPNQTCVFLGDYIDRGPDMQGLLASPAAWSTHGPLKLSWAITS